MKYRVAFIALGCAKNLVNCEQMMERIVPKTKSGDILLFHNSTKYTAESLDKILTELEKKGFIRKDNSKNRAIELLVNNEFEKSNEELAKVPLLGKVTAGSPIEAIEMPNEFFSLPASLLPKGKEVFTLKVSGLSMINAGILDGDIVIVERCNTARNGQIVVAMTDENEVTLKTFYKEKDHIRLQPENDTMEPIILSNVMILGKAIGLYRQI